MISPLLLLAFVILPPDDCSIEQLRLSGIIHSADYRDALIDRAVLGPLRVQEGERVCERLVLTQIRADAVSLVDSAGNIHWLALQEDEKPRRESALGMSTPALPAHAWVSDDSLPAGVTHPEKYHWRLNGDIRQQLQDIGLWRESLRIANEEDGSVAITRIRRDSLPESLGLRVGDVITRINDKPVKEVFGDWQQLAELLESRQAKIEVLRTGEKLQLQYDIE